MGKAAAEGAETVEEEKKEEAEAMEVDEEAKPEEEKEEEKEEEEVEEPEPEKQTAEFTEEDKKLFFRPIKLTDLTAMELSRLFVKFSVPEKSEGFDEMRYEWQNEKKCQERVATYVSDKKLTARMEDLIPSEWFSDRWKSWQKQMQGWQSKSSSYKS